MSTASDLFSQYVNADAAAKATAQGARYAAAGLQTVGTQALVLSGKLAAYAEPSAAQTLPAMAPAELSQQVNALSQRIEDTRNSLAALQTRAVKTANTAQTIAKGTRFVAAHRTAIAASVVGAFVAVKVVKKARKRKAKQALKAQQEAEKQEKASRRGKKARA